MTEPASGTSRSDSDFSVIDDLSSVVEPGAAGARGAGGGASPLAPSVPVAPLPVRRTFDRGLIGTTEWIALGASVIWLVLSLMFWAGGSGSDTRGGVSATLLAVLGIVLPIVMIWVAAVTARTAHELRSEAHDLKTAVEAMRAAWISQQQSRAGQTIERKLDEVAQVARQTENAVTTIAGRRDAMPRPGPAARGRADEQPSLALGPTAEDAATPVSAVDFVRALNFPDSAEDRDGIRALRNALADPSAARLIRAAQDVLNLLAQDAIFMDDLTPSGTRVDLWRRFAQGERGPEITAIGAVSDRSSQLLAASRMRSDTIFRDAVHHFLRQFDKTFASFEKSATDAEVHALAQTRTARAFMLMGRVTQIFD